MIINEFFIFNERILFTYLKPPTMKFLLVGFLFILFNACTPKQEQTNTTKVATISITEKNKELVKAVYAEMASKKNYALIDSFFAPNIFDHGALPGQQ